MLTFIFYLYEAWIERYLEVNIEEYIFKLIQVFVQEIF